MNSKLAIKPVKRYNSFDTVIGAEEVVTPFRLDWTGVAPQPREPENVVQESIVPKAPTKYKLKTKLKCKTQPKKPRQKPKKHKMAKKKRAAVPIIKKAPLPRVKAALRSIRRSREAVPITQEEWSWIPGWLRP